ncbi:hypothetical protein F442_05479 [Phytophthora nicotianae P10297]|uniref:Uncharacterized protein n=2 Tax=Phytophthora nicotianae TaxID=4792 RepID=V9FLD5_PHYNI|nr:hypothetical protein F443_05431 [Phytophthora nicotianae P1569]ETP48870.1 hypothetical protein F442_05479 [Phytophthora nicotianae P10297]
MVVKTSSRCPNGEDESPAAGPPPQLRPQREGFSSCYSCTCSDTATVDADPTVDAPLVRPSEGSAAHQTDNSKQTHRAFPTNVACEPAVMLDLSEPHVGPVRSYARCGTRSSSDDLAIITETHIRDGFNGACSASSIGQTQSQPGKSPVRSARARTVS